MSDHQDLDCLLPREQVGSEAWRRRYQFAGGGVLPDWLIRKLIKIEPFAEAYNDCVVSYGLGHYGYDMRIGYDFRVFTPVHGVVVDPANLDERAFVHFDALQRKDERQRPYCLVPPNSFALGVSVEDFTIPRDVLGVCLGKSTYARCGVVVNVTPLEPEWHGKVTVEISNTSPLPAKIYASQGIAQVLFIKALRTCDISYADKKGKYQGQTCLTLPRGGGYDRTQERQTQHS
jgi:dCTP deaminase